MIKASRKLLCLLSIRLAHWKIWCSDSQRFQTSPSKPCQPWGWTDQPWRENGKERKRRYCIWASQLSSSRKWGCYFSWGPAFWWGLGWLKKLPPQELGKLWDMTILRWLSALTSLQVLSPLSNFSLAGCQAAWGTRGFQGGSRAESAFWKLSSRHGTLSLHLSGEMAPLLWRLLTLRPILSLHFLGIAPSSLHAGPPQLTALSAFWYERLVLIPVWVSTSKWLMA